MHVYTWLQFALAILYTIKSPGKIELALTITDNSIGFSKYDQTSQEQMLVLEDNTISRNGKKVCSSAHSSEIRLCVTKNPINAEFEQIFLDSSVKFKTKGNHVLAIGDYNENTEMYDAVILEENKSHLNKIFFVIEKRDTDVIMRPFSNTKSNKN